MIRIEHVIDDAVKAACRFNKEDGASFIARGRASGKETLKFLSKGLEAASHFGKDGKWEVAVSVGP